MSAAELPSRIEPQPWMVEPATRAVLDALTTGGVEARFVGGVVRDTLLGLPIGGEGSHSDIDLATPAPPERIVELLEQRGIKVVPTGLGHGTVTAIPAAQPGATPRHFEITTLRRDVETYGRRARVAFDADWAADAARRDFTINAIFLSRDGTLDDPTGGLADLAARRVRFVGDPATRIAEDVLRILRYYRFEARFGIGAGDPQARAACRDQAHLLPKLSAERVAQELIRLLETGDPGAALQMMAEDGVLAVILPEARGLDRLRRIVAIEQGLAGEPGLASEPGPDPLRRLAALIAVDPAGAQAVAERLRLSNAWRDRLLGLAQPWPLDLDGEPAAQRHALYRLGAQRYRDLVLLQAADGQLNPDRLAWLLALVRDWTPPSFPLTGHDVTARGVRPGPRVGALLAAAERWWEAADFAPDRAQCLEHLEKLLARDASEEAGPGDSDLGAPGGPDGSRIS